MQAGLLQIIPQAAIFSNESNPYQFVRAKNNLYVWIFACDVRVMCVDKKWDVWGSTRAQSMATHNGRGQADVGQPTKLLPTMCGGFQLLPTYESTMCGFSGVFFCSGILVFVFAFVYTQIAHCNGWMKEDNHYFRILGWMCHFIGWGWGRRIDFWWLFTHCRQWPLTMGEWAECALVCTGALLCRILYRPSCVVVLVHLCGL